MNYSVAVSAKESVFYKYRFVQVIDFFQKRRKEAARRRSVFKGECMYNKSQTLVKYCNLINYYPDFGKLIRNLKVQQCSFENLLMCSNSYKNKTLEVSPS